MCVCALCVFGDQRGQKRASDPVELKLQELGSYQMASETHTDTPSLCSMSSHVSLGQQLLLIFPLLGAEGEGPEESRVEPLT